MLASTAGMATLERNCQREVVIRGLCHSEEIVSWGNRDNSNAPRANHRRWALEVGNGHVSKPPVSTGSLNHLIVGVSH
jgi:hypothetical protein